jgi:Ca2+-binding RTX toxin-like protein
LDDGSFLVQGITNSGPLALIHYKPDGNVDQTFADGVGFITVDADITSLRGVEFCNGEIGIIGSQSGDFSTIDYGKMFFKNGVPDTAFGIDGSLVAPLGSFFSGIIPQADGSLLASTFNSSGAITVLHYTPQGQITQGGPGYTIPNGCDIIAIGSSANNSLLGGVGEDSLVGGSGNETLSSGSGNDTVAPGAGNDSINGGTGTDCADYEKATVAINVNLQSGRESGLGNDTLTSIEDACTGKGADILAGSLRVANDLSSGAGNDTLYGAASGDSIGDTLEGGTGINTYVVATRLDTIIDHGSGSVIRSSVSFDLASPLVSGVNNLVYTGSAGALLKANGAADSIRGGGASDTLVDTLSGHSTLAGGAGSNTYLVNYATDRIIDGGVGSVIESSAVTNLGSNLISGVNNLNYTGGSNRLLGNASSNRIDASRATGSVSIYGGAAADTLIGSDYDDTLVGNGSSSLVGGAGINTYIVNSSKDRIKNTGGGITSIIRSSVGYDLSSTLNGGAGNTTGVNNLTYAANAGAALKGNTKENSIIGGIGKDTIQGWSGAAVSNTANDTLAGGGGADSFIFSATGQTNNAYGNGSGAVALVTDFQGGAAGDKLVLHNFGTGHAGSAGYLTLSGGASILDIYTYQGTDANHLVAHMTLASGTFAWASNASFV